MENRARLGVPKRYAIQIDRAAREFSRLPVEVQSILRLCDGTRSLRALRSDSGLSPALFARVLYRLVTLGLVGAAPEPRPDRRAVADRLLSWSRDVGQPTDAFADCDPLGQTMRIDLGFEDTLPVERLDADETLGPLRDDFSMDEEAFFARTIDHLLEPEERVLSLD